MCPDDSSVQRNPQHFQYERNGIRGHTLKRVCDSVLLSYGFVAEPLCAVSKGVHPFKF